MAVAPCDDWRLSAPQCDHIDMSTAGPPTLKHLHRGIDQHHEYMTDSDLEPVYATISELTDNMDTDQQTSLQSSTQQLFRGLVDVFADLAALPQVDVVDCSSLGSSPPPDISDTPPPRRGTVGIHVARPIPSRTQYRHTPRIYTYC